MEQNPSKALLFYFASCVQHASGECFRLNVSHVEMVPA
jgi:hypothetical protein